jgi:peptidyl-prolyl cis-trans isomerase B (cyclophilin B)
MAKRRRTVTRSHAPDQSYRPGFSRGPVSVAARRSMAPPSARNSNQRYWLIGGAIAAVIVVAALGYYFFLGPGSKPASSPSPAPTPAPTVNTALVHPPSATPISSPPAAPAGDGTTAEIDTSLGTIVFDVYNQSAPVASENFMNLANAGFYNGLTFHRIAPGFVIQGGDPNGDGTGGPEYTIPDEPVVGDYTRGIVAMARTTAPNSAGSQFFIVLDDSVKDRLPKSGDYVIFGLVTAGMDVVDQIAAGQADSNQLALFPVAMQKVTIHPPGTT